MQKSFSNYFLGLVCFTLYCGREIIGLSRFPQNACVSSNDAAHMTCSVGNTETVHWHGYKNGESKRRTIAKGDKINPEYETYYKLNNTESGQFDLEIKSSVSDAALTYICLEPEKADKSSAELIIVEGGLVCEKTFINLHETTNHILSCSAIVAGNWLPRLKWFLGESEVQGLDVKHESPGTSIKLLKKLSVETKSSDAKCTNYTCILSFDEADRPKDTTATNVPIFKPTCKESLFCCGKSDESPQSNAGVVKSKELAKSNATTQISTRYIAIITVVIIFGTYLLGN